MFPFASFFRGLDQGLALPTINITANGGWNDLGDVGFRIDNGVVGLKGDFHTYRKGIYTAITNAWIHDDFKSIVDNSLYEFRVFNINKSNIGLGVFSGFEDELWHPCSSTLWWYLYVTGAQFDGFRSTEVTGEYELREKADVANIVSGTWRLFTSYEGQS